MLVDNDVYINKYVADGSTASFPIAFPFLEASHIEVYTRGEDGEDILVDPNTYTITGAGVETGGELTFNTLPVAGTVIAIIRNVPITQLYAYTELDNFPAESHENALAKLTMIDQQQAEILSRAVTIPVTSNKTSDEYIAEFKSDMNTAVEAAQDAAEDAAGSRDDAAQILVQCQEIADSVIISVNSVLKAATMTISMPVVSGTTLSLPDDEDGEQIKYHVGGHNLLMYYNGAAMFPGEQYNEQGTQGEASGTVKLLQELRAGDTLLVQVLGLDASALVDGESITYDPDTGLSVDLEGLADYVEPAVRDQVDEIIGEDLAAYQKVNTRVWSSGTDYAPGAIAAGSDGNLYVALQASGPSTTAVNPVGDTTGKWAKIISQSDALTSHTQDTYANPVLWNFGGVDCGGDLPQLDGFDEDQWNGATQSVFVDRFAGVYYLSQQNSSYATRLVAMKWSEDPTQRVRLGQTNYSYNIVGHQNNSVYRPTQSDEPLFFFPANYYNSGTSGDVSKKYFVRVAKWTYTTSTPTVLYSLKVFDSGTYTTDNLLAVCVSADSKKLVAEATRNSDNIRVCRVWDAAEVVAYAATATPDGNGQIDITSLVKREFDVPTISVEQGIFCDGFYVYHLIGSNLNTIYAYSVGGPENSPLNSSFTMNKYTVPDWEAGIGTTWTSIQYEPEGIFWAEYGGKVQAFLHVSAALHYDREGADAWKRKDRFFALSIPQRTHVFSKDYLLCFGQGEKPPTETSSTYEHTRFYHVREWQQDPTLSTYSYIASNRGTGTIGTNTMTGGLFFGFSEKKKAVSYYKMTYSALLDEETGTLTHGTTSCFSYSASNVATLGSASELWKEVFAGNAVINTSDERAKDNIEAFPDAVLDAWGEVGWCQYQMKDAIAKKGDAARLHSGVIAQRVASIFEAHGLDASRYGLFCYDVWDDEYEEQEDGTQKLVRKAGDGYGIRYAEALAMEAAYQRRRAARAEARLATLEQRMEEMEQVIAVLGIGGNSDE